LGILLQFTTSLFQVRSSSIPIGIFADGDANSFIRSSLSPFLAVVFLVFSRNNEDVLWMKGSLPAGNSKHHVSTSDFISWSTPVDITTSVVLPEWSWIATGPPGSLIASAPTDAGAGRRLIVPADHMWSNESVPGSHTFYSDNYGGSWHLGKETSLPGVRS
jgi:hypothetical protein